jgi:hypothetical protein
VSRSAGKPLAKPYARGRRGRPAQRFPIDSRSPCNDSRARRIHGRARLRSRRIGLRGN